MKNHLCIVLIYLVSICSCGGITKPIDDNKIIHIYSYNNSYNHDTLLAETIIYDSIYANNITKLNAIDKCIFYYDSNGKLIRKEKYSCSLDSTESLMAIELYTGSSITKVNLHMNDTTFYSLQKIDNSGNIVYSRVKQRAPMSNTFIVNEENHYVYDNESRQTYWSLEDFLVRFKTEYNYLYDNGGRLREVVMHSDGRLNDKFEYKYVNSGDTLITYELSENKIINTKKTIESEIYKYCLELDSSSNPFFLSETFNNKDTTTICEKYHMMNNLEKRVFVEGKEILHESISPDFTTITKTEYDIHGNVLKVISESTNSN